MLASVVHLVKHNFDFCAAEVCRTRDGGLLPQGPHSHILMTGGSDRGSYFIPQKIPTSEFVYPKKSLFFSIPKKIPQCFCISKFYYLSSGKLKHANFNFVKGLELRDLLNISLWIRCAWSARNYFSHKLQSQKYPVIPHKQ